MADREERFRPVAGLPGKLYVPRPGKPCKHPCADCFSCQWCGDTRCAACLGKVEEDGGKEEREAGPFGPEGTDPE
ncbi:MAG: hypothetical protein P1P84_01255 [Deferrisomatales bacterium]|nr:hypothetical protein [Deferrisomatales bacterium]